MSEKITPPLADCKLSEQVTPSTVGSLFHLNCSWDKGLGELTPPIKITLNRTSEESHDTSLYFLKYLKTKSSKPGFIHLEVTGYIPGEYKNETLLITGKKKQLLTSPLSWRIQSVLKVEAKPYPAFGPWNPQSSLWPGLSLLGILLIFFAVLSFKFYSMSKRRKLINNTRENHKTAFKDFINRINKLRFSKKKPKWILESLQVSFIQFLENELFISGGNSYSDLTRQIKKYHPALYKQHKKHLDAFFEELEKELEYPEKIKDSDLDQLLNTAVRVATDLFETR